MFKEELESQDVRITVQLLRQQFQNWFRSHVSIFFMFLVSIVTDMFQNCF
jgi:hypothetical protein